MSSTSSLPQGRDSNRGAIIDAIAIITLVLAVFFVALRIFVRTHLVRWKLGWDDAAILVAIVCLPLPLFRL